MRISHSPRYNETHRHTSNALATKSPLSSTNPQFGIGPKEPIGVRQWRNYKLMMAAIFSTLTVGAAGVVYLIYQGLGKKEPAPTIQIPSQQPAGEIDVTKKAGAR